MLPTRGVGTLKEAEVMDFIEKSEAGILCLVDGDKPYAVPLEHVYRDGRLYFAVSSKDDSRKLNCIKGNNRACYVIYEGRRGNPKMIREGKLCRSLILEGTVKPTAVKEIDLGTRKAKLQILRMDIEKIGNWMCPAEKCDMRPHLFKREPDLLKA